MADKAQGKNRAAKGRKESAAEQSLSALKLETLIAQFPQKIFIKDLDLNYVAANADYARDLKTTPAEMIGRPDYDFYPRELADKYRGDDRRILKAGKPEALEEAYLADGQEFFVYTSKNPLRDDQGRITGILGSFWDITAWKKMEAEVTRQNLILSAINEVFSAALSCETVGELGKKCLGIAEKLTGAAFGFMGEVRASGFFDTVALSDPGWEACLMPGAEAAILLNGMEIRGLWGQVIETGHSLIANTPQGHPHSVGLPQGHPPLTSFLGVPKKMGEKVIGMIALGNKEGGFDEHDQQAMEALASPIVQAMQSKRAEKERQRAEQVIRQQSEEIMELSTPIIQVWKGIVAAPLIGTLDSHRTQGFMERFLEGIVQAKAGVALLDITGVPTVDTQTAQHLLEAITAARLLGTKVVLTGVRPNIAQTMVHLGIDLTGVETCSSLEAGLRTGLDLLNLEVRKCESD